MSSTNNDAGPSPASTVRRAKKLLAPSVKCEIFLQLVRGETTINKAAGVDLSTIMKLRQVAKEGALAALSGLQAGGRQVPAGRRAGDGEPRGRPAVGGGDLAGGHAHPARGRRGSGWR